MLIGAPDKYECASCRKKFVSQLRPPIRLPRVMGEEKAGCECLTYGDVVIHVCHGRKNPSPFKGSEWACSDVCYLALTGEKHDARDEKYRETISEIRDASPTELRHIIEKTIKDSK